MAYGALLRGAAEDRWARLDGAAGRCFHCGDVNPAGSTWRVDVDGVAEDFCCAGCLAVSQTIRAAGLAAFYALRDRRGPTGAVDAGNEGNPACAADVPSELVRDLGGGLRETALLLDGMRCGACVWLIESWLQRQPGVRAANVNFATRRARVRFDSHATDVGAVLRAIARIGYQAFAYDPRRREMLARQESRALLLRASLALLAMMQVMMFTLPAYISIDGVDPEYRTLMNWASLILTLPVMLYSAAPFFMGAWRDVRTLRPGMDVPIALGIAAAFAASAIATITGAGPVYFDSVTMFVALVLVARFVELRVREKAADALESMARDVPQTADRVVDHPRSPTFETVAAAALVPGDLVRVAAGSPVPVDGVVVEGRSSVEEAMLTGESWPRAKCAGDRLMAGSVNRESPLLVRVTAVGDETAVSALSRLVERAANERPRIARLSDRVATAFVAGLLGIAASGALVWWWIEPGRALPIAIAVLVVSCPCALSLATPAALAAAAGALGRRQVLCVRSDALETLSRVTHVVLDKTGTLTTGDVQLVGITPFTDAEAGACRAIAAALEQGSGHPIARALAAFAHDGRAARDVAAIPGCGVEGVVDGTRYRFGRHDWVAGICDAPMPCAGASASPAQTPVALASETEWLATLRFGDTLRPSACSLIASLRGRGLDVSLVSGDRAATVAHVAQCVGIADWHAGATPDDKRSYIEALQRRGAIVAMVGDGINDAPGLARADVSLALGSAATLTQWTADAVVLGDDLARVAFALEAARRTFGVIRQNLGWALAYNVVAIPLAVSGHLSPLAAAIGMSLSSLVVVGNAWRLSRLVRDESADLAAPAVRCSEPTPVPAAHGAINGLG
jgi:Cu2+-exporting ATPase